MYIIINIKVIVMELTIVKGEIKIVIIEKKTLIVLLVVFILSSIIIFIDIPTKIQKILYKKEYSEYVSKYSKEYKVDENLIYAVIKAESNFNKSAKSNKGAIGVMQIMKETAKDIAKKINMQIEESNIEDKLLEADTNINLGTKYISILIEKYGNIEVAIAAYNAGIGTIDNWIKRGIIKADGSDIENVPYKETNNYVRKIIRDYKVYVTMGSG